MKDALERLLSWAYTRQIFGPRCTGYEPGCVVCQRWKFHDETFNPQKTKPDSEGSAAPETQAGKAQKGQGQL